MGRDPLVSVLLGCVLLVVTSATSPDMDIFASNGPVGFNCAAKYVDFNGGWVVDITSYLAQPLWLHTDDLVPGIGGHVGTSSGVKASAYYRIDLCKDLQYFVCPNPPCTTGASLVDQTSFGNYEYSNFTESQILDIPVSSGGTPSLVQYYEKGHSKRVCQDIPTDPWETGLREARLVVECGTSNCPSGTAPVCGNQACLCGPLKLETHCGHWHSRSYQQVILTAIIPTCQPQPAKKVGLNVGSHPQGNNLAVDGLAVAQANLPVVGANETETTFYVSMQDPLNMKDHGVYLSAPEVKFTDWLGKLSPVVTQGGTGGLVNRSSSFPITVRYNCQGAESIATMSLEIHLPPYDSVFLSWQKVCPFTANPPETPMDLIATHQNHEVQFSWSPPGSNNGARVTFYNLEAVPAHPQMQTITLTLSTDWNNNPHVGSLNPVTYVWRGLPGGIMYAFRVQAVNSAGLSKWSAQTTPLMLSPSVPTPHPPPGYYPNGYAYPSPPPSHGGQFTHATPAVAKSAKDVKKGWSVGAVIFFWFCLVVTLGCLGVCIWRSNHGESGFEIVPGHTVVYEVDDRFCGSAVTHRCRRWNPVSTHASEPHDYGPSYNRPSSESPEQQMGGFVQTSVPNTAEFPMKETTSFAGAGRSHYDGGVISHGAGPGQEHRDVPRPPQEMGEELGSHPSDL